MPITNKDLKRRIIDLSYKYNLSHLGSCLTAVDLIEEIYTKKQPYEPFILSSGHAGLALYTVIEKHEGINAESIWKHHGVHPDRCGKCHLDFSTGSLGHGIGAAVGMALANRTYPRRMNVYCLLSDGECAEGSVWEALRVVEEQQLNNLKLYFNINGQGANGYIDREKLTRRINSFLDPLDTFWNSESLRIAYTTMDEFPLLKDIQGHYRVLSEREYKLALETYA